MCVNDLRSFLVLTQLDEEDYEERLSAAGVQLGAIGSVDEELLETLGMRKRFHRKRFLRYAKLLEVADSADVELTQAQMPRHKRRRTSAQDRLNAAVTAGDANGAEEALSRGASVDAFISVAKAEPHTALMHCSLHGFLDVAWVVLAHGADIDLGTRDTLYRPIDGAAFQGQAAMVELLLGHGADPLHRHADGFVALHRACWGTKAEHTEAVLAFLKAGVPLSNARDSERLDDRGHLTRGVQTPLNMSDGNPMTIGLLKTWEATGSVPLGAVKTWGADAFGDDMGGTTLDFLQVPPSVPTQNAFSTALARGSGVVCAAASLMCFAALFLRLAARPILLRRLAARPGEDDAGAATTTSATECPLCFEQYAEDQSGLRVPRILQCGHSACSGCYARLLRPLVADGGFKRLECPECREVTDVPRGRADQLPKNFALMKL